MDDKRMFRAEGSLDDPLFRFTVLDALDGVPRARLIQHEIAFGVVVEAARKLLEATQPGGMGTIRLPDTDLNRVHLAVLKEAVVALDAREAKSAAAGRA